MAKSNKELAVELTVAMINNGKYNAQLKKSISPEEVEFLLEKYLGVLEDLDKHEE